MKSPISLDAIKTLFYWFIMVSILLNGVNINIIDKVNGNYIAEIYNTYKFNFIKSYNKFTFAKRIQYYIFYRDTSLFKYSSNILESLKILNENISKYIKYTSDEKMFGGPYTESIPEIIYYRKGDCEEFAKLFAFITITAYRLNTVVLYVKLKDKDVGHAIVRVRVNGKYYYFDPTINEYYSSFPSEYYRKNSMDDMTDFIFWDIDPYQWRKDRHYPVKNVR